MDAYLADWDAAAAALPGANLLQTTEWAAVKAAYGWQPMTKAWSDEKGNPAALASILKRPMRLAGLTLPLSVLYIPRGPLLDWSDVSLRTKILDDLQSMALQQGGIFLKMDPEVLLGKGVPGSGEEEMVQAGLDLRAELERRGWRYSDDQIQFRNTAVLNLLGSEDDWLARMKQKARYNLRLAQRKGVTVRQGGEQDYALLYRMYAETSVRDGFVIRPEEYYRLVWRTFTLRGMCTPLIAEVEGEPVAAVILFVYAGRAWYLYGMSRESHREKMPNYLLQWEAMRQARALGATSYDLWGAPDVFDESDSMWGVFRFKDGLGARVVRTLGAWDYPANPAAYSLYTRVLPRLLDILRRRGKERTRREVSA